MAFQAKDGEVIEGFLCPICMEDLASITQLQVHFEEKHETEDRAVLNSLKGLFNKAKKKLLSDEERLSFRVSTPFNNDSNENLGESPWEWDTPSGIPSKSHSVYYKKIRSARIDSYVAETNKLLIRLDKLITQIPSDPVKRKAVEREIVPWAENKDVPLCPFCAKSFNIARRRHHCRLCGGIMCDDCSQFLSFSYAQKLISPVHQGSSPAIIEAHKSDDKTHSGPFGSLFGGVPGLRRSGSHGSLNSLISVIDSMSRDKSFRICAHCLSRLATRDKQVELRTSTTLLAIYYEKLMQYRNQLSDHIPQYMKMVNSLMEGETTYHISDAEKLRMQILKLSDSISMTAQKIRNLGASGVAFEGSVDNVLEEGSSAPATQRQDLLQKRIHSSTIGFLKDNVLGLPKLLSKDEIIKRQEKRRKERDVKMAAEREAAKLAEERATSILKAKRGGKENSKTYSHNSNNSSSASSSSSTPRKTYNNVNIDSGWGADTSAHMVTETDDPIVQQMNIIRNYIRQARDASKYDEVSLLEANLKELQIEYKRRAAILDAS